MKELTQRVFFAIPAAAMMLYITWIGGVAFEILFGAISLFTIWEVHGILEKRGSKALFPISLIIAVLVWFFADLPDWGLVVLLITMLGFTIAAFFIEKVDILRPLFSTLFTGIYAPVGFLFIVNTRNMGAEPDGFWLILSFFLMIWGNDVFAYFGGKTWGKTPLAPVISPNKTREGFWFGFLGAAVGFIIAYLIAKPFPLPLSAMAPAVLIIGFLGPLGDIAESKLKRIADVKDSSRMLPGHGGFFDRFDSMILTAPFIFFLYYLFI